MTKVRSAGQRQKHAIKRMAREWTAWQEVPVDEEMRVSHPVLKHVSKIYANSRMEVSLYNMGSSIGGIVHAVVFRHRLLEPVTVNELQRVKAELFGAEKTAVEIYPPNVTDLGMTRHLWIMPEGYSLPYGLDKPNAFGEPV